MLSFAISHVGMSGGRAPRKKLVLLQSGLVRQHPYCHFAVMLVQRETLVLPGVTRGGGGGGEHH